jgi:hypothetical protein
MRWASSRCSAIVADQQKVADTFFDLKLIPKAVAVRDAVWDVR